MLYLGQQIESKSEKQTKKEGKKDRMREMKGVDNNFLKVKV